MVSTLLSIFAPAPLWVRWSDVVSVLLAAVLRFNQGDGTVLEVCHQLGRNSGPRQGVLFQAPVEGAHGFDILFPNGKQKLDVSCLAHRLTKRRGKCTGLVEARLFAT